MQFEFVQWHPDPNVPANKKEVARHVGGSRRSWSFDDYWKQWCLEYPHALKLVTLAGVGQKGALGYGAHIELRLWFGEPHRFYPSHVDSMGYNLIVHIWDENPESAPRYRLMAERLLQGKPFSKETVNEVEVWRIK